jgi:hypothetical protein
MKYAYGIIGLLVFINVCVAGDPWMDGTWKYPVQLGKDIWRVNGRVHYVAPVVVQDTIIRGRCIDATRDGFYVRPQDYIVLAPNQNFIAPRTMPITTLPVSIGRR